MLDKSILKMNFYWAILEVAYGEQMIEVRVGKVFMWGLFEPTTAQRCRSEIEKNIL